MEQMTFHKQKLYSLIIAGIALISLMLPWLSVSLGIFGGNSANGFRGWGILSLFGIIGVGLACFMGNKAVEFDELSRKIALGSFGAIALGALIFYLRKNSADTLGITSTGAGLWICLAAGALGLIWVLGKIKLPDPKKPL